MTKKTLELEFRRNYGDQGSKHYKKSKADTLKTLPSYQGDYKAKFEVQKVPLTTTKSQVHLMFST